MKERGKFFIFEGVGGSGKSTQAELATNYLNSIGEETILTREPGGIKEAEEIRELIFKLKSEKLINADHQMAFFFSARVIWKNGIVIPNLELGKNVSSDRSFPATNAYQGYGEGGDLAQIEKISRSVMENCMPSGIVLLNLSVETAMERNSKNKDGDPFDDEGKDYFARVINGYQEMAESNWCDVPWYVIDAEQDIDSVQEDVREVLHDILASNARQNF